MMTEFTSRGIEDRTEFGSSTKRYTVRRGSSKSTLLAVMGWPSRYRICNMKSNMYMKQEGIFHVRGICIRGDDDHPG